MTARNTPAGRVVSGTILFGDAAIFVVANPVSTSYGFPGVSGVEPFSGTSSGGAAPNLPTTGQLWPRGNP